MIYTDEQQKKIESNLDQIVAYIKENIQPNIPNDEQISVHFHSENSRHENRLCVSSYDIDGYVGAAHVHFNKGEKKSYSDCVYKYTDWMLCFVLGWKEVKKDLHSQLNEKIEAHQRIVDAIENFEV